MQTNYVSVPIAGCLKHGELFNNRPRELGYFITKIREEAMQHLNTRFEQLYNKQKEVIIYIFSEDACSIKRVKKNQSGTVCYCLADSEIAKEKVNKKWVEKQCTETCESRQTNGKKAAMCQEELTLRFLIPNVSKDRIFILQSKSYHTRNNIFSYINLQKQLGNSIKGYYKLFLTEKVSEKEGNKFTNYVVDIVKLEDSDLQAIPKNSITTNTTTITTNNQTSQNSKPTTNVITKNNNSEQIKETPKTNKDTVKQKKQVQTKAKPEQKQVEVPTTENTTIKPTEDNLQKYYILLDTSVIELEKKGQLVKYTQGHFVNKDDKECNIILHPNFAGEIVECALGSQFLFDTIEKDGKIFATSFQVIDKQLKEAV